ncbi:acyl-CoA thioester hydrolase/BAAT C-terminal domain-containing protein [Stomatohabitans albus]|uniref:acyl-CoA thioester hydrolase/BAAT C-terminal domain-containing protein n=1 Tax=Stomatohabitans albus TaxID=3110766 RepID=UPI00300D3C80
MRLWKKILIGIGAIILVVAVTIVGVRTYNYQHYFSTDTGPNSARLNIDFRDADAYPLDRIDGVTITPVTGEHMAGFHFKPEKRTRKGILVSYGGSEGGVGWPGATLAAKAGQESLALFFWGQPNQTATLDEVPLEDFQEVIDWIDANAESPEPLIAAGGSKGAEYVANLLPRYDRIDHAILIAPASHSFPALSQHIEHSSWTWGGKPVPNISWEDGGSEAMNLFYSEVWKFWVNLPVAFEPSYSQLLNHAPDETRIHIEDSQATIHAFAGDDDNVWPSAEMANRLKAADPDRVTVTVYPKVGHMPGAPQYIGGLNLGGTNETNFAAEEPFNAAYTKQLEEWAPLEE